MGLCARWIAGVDGLDQMALKLMEIAKIWKLQCITTPSPLH